MVALIFFFTELGLLVETDLESRCFLVLIFETTKVSCLPEGDFMGTEPVSLTEGFFLIRTGGLGLVFGVLLIDAHFSITEMMLS